MVARSDEDRVRGWSQRCERRQEREMSEARVVLEGLGFPESTRWHDGRIWLCNWDAAGNAYVNAGDPGVVLVGLDGSVRVGAEGLAWPNGMALLDDGRTLVVADSHLSQLIAYDVAGDGSLSARRVWADLEHAPDGI